MIYRNEDEYIKKSELFNDCIEPTNDEVDTG